MIKKIFINPGHSPNGNPDPGATGNGLRECDVVLKIGKRLETYLQNAGFSTQLLQSDTPSRTFNEICDPANEYDADLFVSIHCNAFNGVANGTETHIYPGSSVSREPAQFVHKQIVKAIPQLTDRGVRESNYAVLRKTNMPAILVETAFIDNYEDSKILVDHEDDFAIAIAKGIFEYAGIGATYVPDVVDKPAKVAKQETFEVDINKIAVLARKYESNGDPACVANNAGDLGGVSYGLYQFASNVGAVDDFVDWLCAYPDPALANYGKVLARYETNSSSFIEQWKDLGTIDPGHFGELQDEYIVEKYFNTAAKKLAAKYFNVNKHSNAIKAVILSRAVQNGPSGCAKLFGIVVERMGYGNLSYVDDSFYDAKVISAIYEYLIAECDLATLGADGIWRSPDDFCHGSKSIISALRNRFVHEKEDALNLL